MTLGFLFWLIMVLWAVLRLWGVWAPPQAQPHPYWAWGDNLLLFVLFFLVGWRIFGFVIQGG